MSRISDKVAADHTAQPIERPDGRTWQCRTCGPVAPMGTESDMLAHVAAMTEAAVREAIAADVEAGPTDPLYPTHSHALAPNGVAFMSGVACGAEYALTIVKGES